MALDVNKLPKKINEFNYFEKNENGGCTMYSYSSKSDMIIVCELNDFEIEENFCIDSKAIEMLKVLSPIDKVSINKSFNIKSKKGNYKGKIIGEVLFTKPKINFEHSFEADFNLLKIASSFCATNTKRIILTGVNVNSNGDINATDSFVAYRHVNEENVGKTCYTITIPKEFVDFINKNIDIKDKITINFNYNSCINSSTVLSTIFANFTALTREILCFPFSIPE